MAHEADDWVGAVQRLARDETLWCGLSHRAQAALQREHAPEHFAARIAETAFGSAGA